MITRKRVRGTGMSEWYCMSTDTKPTAPYPEGAYNGDPLLEMDTGNLYLYDGEREECTLTKGVDYTGMTVVELEGVPFLVKLSDNATDDLIGKSATIVTADGVISGELSLDFETDEAVSYGLSYGDGSALMCAIQCKVAGYDTGGVVLPEVGTYLATTELLAINGFDAQSITLTIKSPEWLPQ